MKNKGDNMPLVNKPIRLLALIGLTLLLNACSEDNIAEYPEDNPEYNYNVDTVYRYGEIYSEWFVYDEYDPYNPTDYVGDAYNLNHQFHVYIAKNSEFCPAIPTEGTGSYWNYSIGTNKPHYEVVAKLQVKCLNPYGYGGGIIIGIEQPWQYAYGQYETVYGENNSIHGHIFRIFELFDNLRFPAN